MVWIVEWIGNFIGIIVDSENTDYEQFWIQV